MRPRPIAAAVSWAFPLREWGHSAAHWIYMYAPTREQMQAFIRFQLERMAEREKRPR